VLSEVEQHRSVSYCKGTVIRGLHNAGASINKKSGTASPDKSKFTAGITPAVINVKRFPEN
jgi:hypothetical protein